VKENYFLPSIYVYEIVLGLDEKLKNSIKARFYKNKITKKKKIVIVKFETLLVTIITSPENLTKNNLKFIKKGLRFSEKNLIYKIAPKEINGKNKQ
jgi:hypothetical protein